MSDVNNNLDSGDENEGPLKLSDATYIARDGMDLLDCVTGIETGQAPEGRLRVETDRGNFVVEVTLEDDTTAEKLADEHGGHWGKHPDHPVSDWQYEVENHETRLGYWEWVADRVRNAESDDNDGPSAHTTS